MSAALDGGWTKERFLDWAERQEARFEFDGTRPVAMTGGTGWHSAITGNVITALRTRLRGKACSVFGPDLAIETPGGKIRYPDALVTCTKFPGSAKIAPDPVVVFEVPGPGSGGVDRIEKLREYAGVASVRRYVILEGGRIGVMVLERGDATEPWRASVLTGEDVLRMPEITTDVPIGEFYDEVDFAAALDTLPDTQGIVST